MFILANDDFTFVLLIVPLPRYCSVAKTSTLSIIPWNPYHFVFILTNHDFTFVVLIVPLPRYGLKEAPILFLRMWSFRLEDKLVWGGLDAKHL